MYTRIEKIKIIGSRLITYLIKLKTNIQLLLLVGISVIQYKSTNNKCGFHYNIE